MSRYRLVIICLAALAIRLVLLPLVNHPGIGDPNHYYNLGVRLVEGYGFTIDYIWQYNDPPADIVHPDDHWMPLTGVTAAAGMKLLGTNVPAALLPFILAGGCVIPMVAYAAARQFGCSENGSLAAAGFAAVLPELVLNSLRTDTTVPNIVFVCGSVLLFNSGLRRGQAWPMIGSGVLAGLAYLTRNDALVLIPAYGVTVLILLALRSRPNVPRLRWRHLVLLPLAAGVVVSPWIVRNIQVLGTPATRELSKMLFFTDVLDHYAYEREFSLQTLLAVQTPAQLIGKRLFELAAAGKLMVATLDVFLPVAVVGGLILLVASRDRERLLILTSTLVALAALLVVYPILVPYKSQAGSFKKAYLSIIPLLIPLGIYALERAVPDARLRAGTLILGVTLTGANAFGLVRTDAQFTRDFYATMQKTAAVVKSLPDTNGDGKILLMTQDPFMLRFLGIQSVMIPAESRDKVLEVARRYQIDYILMPPDRPSLDPIYWKTETDPHFRDAAAVPGTSMLIYRFDFDSAGG